MHWKAECDKVLKRFTQASGGQSEDVWIFAYRFQDQQIGLSRNSPQKVSHFTHYLKSQIFVQKFNFEKNPRFSQVFHPIFWAHDK